MVFAVNRANCVTRTGQNAAWGKFMSFELIGLIVFGLAALAFVHSSRAAFTIMLIASLFQAAAALRLGNGGQITPGHLALGFFALAIVVRRGGLATGASAAAFPRAGFWLLLMTVWAACTAIIMPRLFYGEFQVIPLGITNSLGIIAPIPHGPVSSNLNQSVYFTGNLVAFLGVVALCRSHRMVKAAAVGALVAIGVNIGIVVMDQAMDAAGQSHLLKFIRNAEFSQLFHAKVFGMKRITGSFPEASAYAGAAMGMMAFCLRLWRGGIMTRVTGPMTLVVLLTVVLSTSTTAYVALGAYLFVIYSFAAIGIDPALASGHAPREGQSKFLKYGPLVVLGIIILMAVRPDIFSFLTEFMNSTVSEKITSDSGQERSSWNTYGINTIINTMGLGAGLGSVRTSSFVIGLPANIGLIGTFFFAMFFLRLFQPGKARLVTHADYESRQIAAAARSACFAIIIAASISAGTIDLGIMFFAFAGIANAAVFQQVTFDRVGGAAPMFRQARRRPRAAAPAE